MVDGSEVPNILKLPHKLNPKAARDIYSQLLKLKGRPIEVDATAVQKSGTQCIQILLAAQKAWQNDNNNFLIGNASDTFDNSLKLLGISNELLPFKLPIKEIIP